ncbi:MAG: flagellar hook-length control protein FliK [Aeromonas sp.]|uniref:flagellar hook-length control protein FliK n=1 Tax=Aeromonas sp. TaxID=647 RepID=UPI003F356970
MIQTQLLTASPQAKPVDGAATSVLPAASRLGSEGDLQLPGEGQAVFADAMARQLGQQETARQDGAPAAPADAKSLAADETSQTASQKSEKADEAELPPDDFLQQLQASLGQDTSLVVPQGITSQHLTPATQPDGNDLPPESPSIEGSTDKPVTASTGQQGTSPRSGLAQGSEIGAGLAQSGDPASESGAASRAAKSAAALGIGSAAGSDADVALAGKPAAPSQAGGVNPDEEAPDLGASGKQVADKAVAGKETGSKPETQPLSGPERAAQLAKMAAGDAGVIAEKGDSAEQTVDGKQAVQAKAARVFGEGVASATLGADSQGARVDGKAESRALPGAQVSQSGATAAAAGSYETGEARPGAKTRESGPAQAPMAKGEGAKGEGATSGQTPVAQASAAPVPDTSTPEPELAAPQQILARHESQGPQASLAALSAGIQQMESTPTVVVKAGSELKKTELKGSLDEVGKSAGLEAKPAQQAESSSATQQQLASQGSAEQKSVAETGARREAQSLPHLKLATPETPVQLHQKVNLMLTDKLQQAEIQLDPLGLGKMKIQIQMGADSQANVNFVVQHGQTREMLEQAMPRLRDMLAGQGIQLGQTQVQQQSQQQSQQQGQLAQQQSQGQSNLGGQGQQGSGAFGGRGQGEAEGTTHTLSLLVESANDAGIDFYA